jgi:hypothetical protein
MSVNPLAYARAGFAEGYGNAYDNYQGHIAPIKQRPLYRIWSPYATNSFGPLNSSLESRTEATYGYNPLELARYAPLYGCRAAKSAIAQRARGDAQAGCQAGRTA